jgi:hypothetical protein
VGSQRHGAGLDGAGVYLNDALLVTGVFDIQVSGLRWIHLEHQGCRLNLSAIGIDTCAWSS